MFKETFKYYKAKCPPPDLQKVIDFDRINLETVRSFPTQRNHTNVNNNCLQNFGVSPSEQWKIYELIDNPGIIFIQNPFTKRGQRYWISKCLRDYPRKPHVNNMTANKAIRQAAIEDWWKCLQNCDDLKEKDLLKTSMRWTTLGYHHDWDTKVYIETKRHKFPDDLAALTKCIAEVLGFNNYSAEAAIVNYYPIGTTLAGHTDHSEADLDAPLFSFSFGQTAIFLIGGKTKDVKPSAVFLKSGDIIIMSRESRLSYHAVPKIFKSIDSPWNDTQFDIKINKRPRLDTDNSSCTNDNDLDSDLWLSVNDENYWHQFENYIKDCRININVRQVLKLGQTSLPASNPKENY